MLKLQMKKLFITTYPHSAVELLENNDVHSSNDTMASECAKSSNFVISALSGVCSIILTSKIKKREHPKVSEFTVVSLPKKRLEINRNLFHFVS